MQTHRYTVVKLPESTVARDHADLVADQATIPQPAVKALGLARSSDATRGRAKEWKG
jgi:hypothetical protein